MMMTREFRGEALPLLGFGAMRLPVTNPEDSATIDERAADKMIRYAWEQGVRYFDTAYTYHDGMSERVLGLLLQQFPRDSYAIATKYPGHMLHDAYDPKKTFEEQLQKCGVSYFDYYLLHNISEKSLATYMDPRWGIMDYFREQKKNGRIRHFGFSAHGEIPNLREFLDVYGEDMEFCQLQLNYLDWTLQDAKEKYELMTERDIDVWVMEPVRGGKLAALSEANEQRLKALRPEESIAAWAFRWVQTLPNVKMVLSGMSNMEQVQDNVKTFSGGKPLTEEEAALLLTIAEEMKDDIPCTACRYCCPACPQELDIPLLLGLYNEMRVELSVNLGVRVSVLEEGKKPMDCIACGACSALCPQSIDIPAAMSKMGELYGKIPAWEDICRMRDEAIRRNS